MGQYYDAPDLLATISDLKKRIQALENTTTPIVVVNPSGDTSGATDKAAISSAVASLPAPHGGIIWLPGRSYYLPTGSGISWNDRRVSLIGFGRGSSAPGTMVQVAAGGTSFNPQNGPNGYGAGSRIEGLYIKGSDTGAGSNAGILLQCNGGEIARCDIEGFGRHAIHVLSGNPGSPFVANGSFNANCWHVDHCRVANNFGSGLFTEGVDSNAGESIGLDASNNAGEGIYENSSFGNTHYSPHFQANASHAIRCSGNSRSCRFYGVYKDGDSTPAVLIESGNGGGNIIDFRVLLGNSGETIVDNSATQDNRITSQAGGMLHERLPTTRLLGSDAAWSTTTPTFFLNTGATKTTMVTMAKVVTTNASDQQGIAYPLGTLPVGTYAASLYLRGNAGGELLEFFAGLASAGSKVDLAVTGTTYWTRVSGQFTADGATACYIGLKTQAGHAAVATFFVDDVQVTMA